LRPFVPIFRNPHALTIAGNFWPRTLDVERFPIEANLYETEPGVQVLVHSQRPAGDPLGQVIVIHGLEGSSDSGYARSFAQAALERGWTVHRFNMRSCGGTEHLSGRVLYHSGQTDDLACVIEKLYRDAPLFLAGFSLGGNVSLKLAGELGSKAQDRIAGVAAVSTPIDLAASTRHMRRPVNLVYSRRFLRRLKDRVRRKESLTPGLFPLDELPRVHTIHDFDDRFTAQAFGFGSADNYYATQSANQFLNGIRVPALCVQAKDDPMVPFAIYDHPAFRTNPHLRLLAVDHGGHLGFLSKDPPRFWLDAILLDWMTEQRNKVRVASVL
jgi:predicted alpha/beta-fold hydrolase